ncbi:MAG TPA: TIGR02996 domain-containing protein [Gemmataceae bacterium]|jgi:uncharacterized protein (TIGR02996 family)
MTPNDAFLQAILANPEDDTPRLVYADWLDERGDPRGEFIRVQCQMAILSADDERRPPLEQQERRLLERHQDEWLGPLRHLLGSWLFRRGFLEAITVPATTYLRQATFPCPATVRRVEVDLDGFEVPPAVLAFVPESVARENELLPIGFHGRTLVLAVRNPLDTELSEKMRFILNRTIKAIATPERQIGRAIRRHYGEPDPGGPEPDLAGCFASPLDSPLEEVDLGSWDQASRASGLLTRCLAMAIRQNACEIRIEPGPDRFRVLYRGDHGTVEGQVSPGQLLGPLVTRIRIAASIFLGDRRDEQAGSFHVVVRGRQIAVGVLIRRTADGPVVVLSLRPPDQIEASASDGT